ncbi:NADH:ubiquinone reductase (Na(+)-transporting) subunit F [Diaphorobacter caeni]|uniref:NADH:ubiquinone reductase (Na(+)-transporting) subunit F n=1 Tax=Diaphorobacter caeni TaxID=2784387 RepID=UPI00188E466B|nr:2Fe-2S iron-sulfur cluster binding domain-containing protein [Diaphorobacter caeni]MBF5006995.1 2Fe-2S iron-sulfur cluster binding domain-containing protein [Diaphorobacter caeni]
MSFQLTLEPLGATIEVEEGQTLLDAALRQGIYIPHACGHGLCGTCKVQVCDGEVDHGAANPFALMDMERDDGKTLACCATLQADTTIEADIEDEPDALIIPVRDFGATVVRIEQLTPTIKALHLRLDQPMQYQAGQYVQVRIPSLGQSRAFSIANAPEANGFASEIELNVRQVPGGAGTTWLHEALKEGARIDIAGPYGRFFVRHSAAQPMVFMAGGSGLSSPRAMIQELLARDCNQPITLIYGQRSREELYYDDEFRALAAEHPHFTYIPAISGDADAGAGWDGARGFVHEAAREHFAGNFSGRKAYLCGPPPMVEACIATLMQGRLFERDIYTEKFISAADAQGTRSPLFKRV